MSENEQIINTVAPLRNVAALTTLTSRVLDRNPSLPGMAVFYGPSGFGKTVACTYATVSYEAVMVQVKSTWTKKKLCQAILAEMGVPAAKTVSDMLDQICEHLAITGVPLLIDEADFLVDRRMIEIARDIYEGSFAPVILVGEELLPQKLRAFERVHGRILDWVAAQPGDLSDVKQLARIYAPGIEIDAALQDKLLKGSNASIRRICVNLDHVQELARRKGLKRIGLEDWGSRSFFTGVTPEVRRFEGRAM